MVVLRRGEREERLPRCARRAAKRRP